MNIVRIILCSILFAVGCTHTRVIRTGRVERAIKVSTTYSVSEADLVIWLMRKAQIYNCESIKVTNIVEGSHIEGICYGYQKVR